MSDHEHEDLRERLIRLETIIGDDNRGVLAELKTLRRTVESLREFQVKVLGVFGALAVGAQVAIQFLLK
jgi:hypothetical protein